MKQLEPYAYAAFRIVSGSLFAFHGAQKIFGIYGGHVPAMWSQMWAGGLIELCGGLAVALGLSARWAAFICSGTMAVAYFQFHWKFRFDANFWPAVNHGEAAVLYCFIFLLIFFQGSGRYSVKRD